MGKLWKLTRRRTWATLAMLGLLASMLATSPAVAANEEFQYSFEFVNGEIIEGTSADKDAFLPDAGGASVDNPSGMIVHLSCSDKFEGGWGKKKGPDPDVDTAWRIAGFEISKFKDGKLNKTCSGTTNGDVPAKGKFKMFRFEFVNGQVVEGMGTKNDHFIPEAGGMDPDNPTGMTVHLSCSDKFTGGFGEKEGPDPVVDSAWQILRFEIKKIKDGKVDKTCSGGLPQPPADPSIDLEKTVNGEDADNPTGPTVDVGDTVTLGYTVENTGNVTLTNVEVVDFDLGPVSCPLDTLAAGESMTCNEAQVLVESPGQVFMEAKVTGKATIGVSAPVPDPTADVKSYTFAFENGAIITGFSEKNEAFLPNAGGTDPDNPTGMTVHVSCSDKFTGGFGDKDGPDPVADSAWQIAAFEITKYKKGKADKTCGQTFTPVMRMVMDADPVHYIAVIPPDPSIDIEKTVNGIDADDPPGPEFMVGDKITVEYVVKNTGNVKLFNIVVVDSDLGVRNCERTMLEPDESMSCDMFMETLTEPGAVFMKATVTGEDDGREPVMDMDTINFTVVDPPNPSIDIEKTVNGIDADDPPGPEFMVGDKITIEYVVKNTGNVKLFNVEVFDFTLNEVRNCEKTMLEPDESMSCDMLMEVLTQPGAVFMKAAVNGEDETGRTVEDEDPINFTVLEGTGDLG